MNIHLTIYIKVYEMKSIKQYIPNMTESVKVVFIVTVLAVSGIGAMIVAKVSGIVGRR